MRSYVVGKCENRGLKRFSKNMMESFKVYLEMNSNLIYIYNQYGKIYIENKQRMTQESITVINGVLCVISTI